MRGFTVQRRYGLIGALIALAIVFIGAVLLNSRWRGDARIDLTHDHVYTLTPGTLQVIDGIKRPLRLTLYFSDRATRDIPQLRSYEERVWETLQEMVAHSGGRIILQLSDPMPYSDAEASAESAGLLPLADGTNGERVFFGLVAAPETPREEHDSDSEPVAGARVIPFFDPQRESFLEYDISRLLYELGTTNKPRLGVLSGLPVMAPAGGSGNIWTSVQQLSQMFDLQVVQSAPAAGIPRNIDALLLIHPKALSEQAQYAIDQFVMRGGHLAVFVDPDAEMDSAPVSSDTNQQAIEHASDLTRLFTAWGVIYEPGKVVLDRSRGLPIDFQGSNLMHVGMLGLGGSELNHGDPITAGLQRINVSSAGYFDLARDATSRLLPLIQTTADAEVIPVERFIGAASDPSSLLQDYRPGGQPYVIASRLHGVLPSAFPEYAAQPGHLTHSPAGTEVILVADTDVLSDRLWLDTTTQPPRLLANNAEFVSNIALTLTGAKALLSIPGHGTSLRPFTRVLSLQNAADQKFKAKEQELERELDETRQRIDQLQSAKNARPGAVTTEQQHEIEQFMQRRLTISRELREVQRQLNVEIDALGLRLKILNIVGMPLLVIVFGLIYGFRRTRQRRPRA